VSNKIGQGWYEGNVSVQQEHFTSALAIRQLEALLAATLQPAHDVRILIACPPHELHTFSPLVLALLFRRRGYDVVYLGANVPVAQLETAVLTIHPQLVILSAQTLFTAAQLLPMAQLLYEMHIPLAYGGAVFSYLEDIKALIPGHFLGNELQTVPEAVKKLLKSLDLTPAAQMMTPAYKNALTHFIEKRAAIEADLQEKAGSFDNIPATLIHFANQDLGNNIEAALTLGNINLLSANINWVKGLLMNYHYRMPDELMHNYLSMYYAVVSAKLDEQGKPVTEWFTRLLKSDEALISMRHQESN
ncbi:MAG: B12-binding domain-containing protein, partial [Anaerolineae bacterium]